MNNNNLSTMGEESQIQKFYKDKTVFITGATGFFGKILIEKLLRCTELTTIYVLIREKRGKSIDTRVDELFDDVLFDKLRKQGPKFKHRIEVMPGDVSVTGLGLSIHDRQKLINNTNIIFHVAATVRFDENLKLAYDINVNGIRDVIEMARQMRELNSIIHVSTAYSNCHLNEIDEIFYDQKIDYEDVSKVLEKVTMAEADELTPRIIAPWPNTYTFTKCLAESVIKNSTKGLPIGVYRPSIVLSTYKDPVSGWIDNVYGPTGVCAATMSGVLRVVQNDKEQVADMVPVDLCVAGLIAAAWDVAGKDCERTPENIPIYNYVSSTENPITWEEFHALNIINGEKAPIMNNVWTSTIWLTKSSTLYWILTLFLHLIPGVFFDTILIISGQPPRMLKLYKKIHKFSRTLAHFSRSSWKFSNKNTVDLWKRLNRTDQELFPFSITQLNWVHYFKGYMRGIRLHLLKEPETNIPQAKIRAQRLKAAHVILKCFLNLLVASLIGTILSKLIALIY